MIARCLRCGVAFDGEPEAAEGELREHVETVHPRGGA